MRRANTSVESRNPKSHDLRPPRNREHERLRARRAAARRGKFIKLNTNENPYPCSPAVGRAIAAVLERGLQRYPDPMAEAFRRRAAEVLGVEPDWILCGNGSDDILTIATRAFVGQGDCLRLPYPSYILYQDAGPAAGSRGRGGSLPAPIGRWATILPHLRRD